MNFSKLATGWKVFTAGQSMVNAIRGKQAQVAASAITAFLGAAIAAANQLFGWKLPDDATLLTALGVVIYSAIQWLLTAATTDKISITGKPTADAVEAERDAKDSFRSAVSVSVDTHREADGRSSANIEPADRRSSANIEPADRRSSANIEPAGDASAEWAGFTVRPDNVSTVLVDTSSAPRTVTLPVAAQTRTEDEMRANADPSRTSDGLLP